MAKESGIRFQINPRIACGISTEVEGAGAYLRGFTYKATPDEWAKLRTEKQGRRQIFVKAKGV